MYKLPQTAASAALLHTGAGRSPRTSPWNCPVDGGAFRGLCRLPCSVTQTRQPKACVAQALRRELPGFWRVSHGNSFSVFSAFMPLDDTAMFFTMINNFAVKLVMP